MFFNFIFISFYLPGTLPDNIYIYIYIYIHKKSYCFFEIERERERERERGGLRNQVNDLRWVST